jgi:glycosyltransferase A (GT-A) superfamily protein (DUF2064 family)
VDPPDAVGEVAELAGDGVKVFAQAGGGRQPRLAAAVARVATGPLLLAVADCPRLGPAHAEAAGVDLAAGCDAVVGTALNGDWYLAALAEPRADLLALATARAARPGAFGRMLATAHALGVKVGVLRHERLLRTPDDLAAHLADPLLPRDLRAVLAASAA